MSTGLRIYCAVAAAPTNPSQRRRSTVDPGVWPGDRAPIAGQDAGSPRSQWAATRSSSWTRRHPAAVPRRAV